MRVPLSWLLAYCDPGLSPEQVADRLVMTGTEVARVESVGVGGPENFVVGKVLEAEQHPDADRLRVCRVDAGEADARTIVCGAPNVAAGQTVAVALPGAVMPGGTTLGEAKLRGVRSSGMILAEDEVEIGGDHDGIMVLPETLAAGTPLAEALPIADRVLELEITPNRPDCLAVYGVARELHAATGAPLAVDPTDEDAPGTGDDHAEDHARVEILDPEICPRFTARVFEDVTIGPSPLWLKARLTAAGQRPISNVVDITNYVMLLVGQPLHAFDLDRVRGGRIEVRRAHDGERMTTLDGVERTFDPTMALVCDAEGPSGIAGIMGGQISEVSESTTRVLMEAATWVGPNILRTSSRLGLRSEASTRFEKQLHPEQAIAAQRLAARLMVELCGARMVPGTIDVHPHPAPPRVVGLRPARVTRLLGQEVPRPDIDEILGRLGFTANGGTPAGEANGGGAAEALEVTVPPFRDADVQREADLVEEVARIHGLEKLPVTLPARQGAIGRLRPDQRARRRLEDALRDRGASEIVAWSYTAPDTLGRLRLGDLPTLRVANPLSEDGTVLRPLLLPGLLDAARHNTAHGQAGLRLFESAHVYRASASLGEAGNGGPPALEGSERRPPAGAVPAAERHHVGGLLTEALPATWRHPAQPADFYAAKALLFAALEAVGLRPWAEAGERPFLHPGRTATVLAGDDQKLGWVGELHPSVARAWDLEGGAAFEVDADLVAELAPGPAAYRDLTSFPAVRQDIAVVVADEVSAAEVEAAVRAGGGQLLRGVSVFDLYRGEQVGEGHKSLALRLEFRAGDRTLTDEEVAGLRAAIEGELEALGGRLRA